MSERIPGLLLEIERTFAAPAQAVFDAWTDEAVLSRWFHAGRAWETPTAEVDLRVGGRVRLVMRDPDGDEHGATGKYTIVDPPHRLAFTWTWDDHGSERQLIELEFTENDGATTVRMTSHGIATNERRENHREGWGLCFDNLDQALAVAGGTPDDGDVSDRGEQVSG